MGAGDSKLSFKKGVFRLSEETNIPASDAYWESFWTLPDTAEDVFTLFSATDIRRARDLHIENIETLVLALTSRLFFLRTHKGFPYDIDAPGKHALNCIRVLTRVLPFIYEKEELEEWQQRFFWGKRRQRRGRGLQQGQTTEVIFDEADPNRDEYDGDGEGGGGETEFEDAPPLMEALIDCLIDLLFYAGFTLPPGKHGESVTYAIWESGVGCKMSAGSTKDGDANKSEILRLLLAIMSKAMFMPASVLPVKGERALTYMAAPPDLALNPDLTASQREAMGPELTAVVNKKKKIVLSVLCSLLNTTLNYNQPSWGLPYDHVVLSDPRQVLVTYSLQLLLVLLLYPVPEGAGPGLKNVYRYYLGKLHRPQDFQHCFFGMMAILNQPMHASSSYLPGSQKTLKWAPEMMMLFWEVLQCNKRFRSFIIDTGRVHDFVIATIYYIVEYRQDPSKAGVVRMCIFVLQTLSTEANFGKSLNKRFEVQNTLPQSVRIPGFCGTFADYLLISIYMLITTSKGKLSAVYPALLAIIANVAPHVQNLSSTASAKLLQLFTSMSTPSFLLANETNHTLLHSLLESINSIVEHQYSSNPNFIYAILRAHKRFDALRDFTLDGAQQEIHHEAQRRKDNPHSSTTSAENSPKVSISIDRAASNLPTPRRSEEPLSPGVFELGDEDDEDDDAAVQSQKVSKIPESPRQAQSQPSRISTEEDATIVTSPVREHDPEDAVPLQLRGMSEKARGKLPASAFQRQGSTTTLASHHSTASAAHGIYGPGGFEPTPEWIETWLPLLPLHTILTTLSHLLPSVSHLITTTSPAPAPAPTSPTPSTSTSPPPPAPKRPTQTVHTLLTTLPPPSLIPSPIKTHMFEWSPLALGWYESLLWGFIYVSERNVQKGSGTVGVWNGTRVRLFKVQETAPERPSLLAPRGGVDAVGMSLVQRVGGLTMRGQQGQEGEGGRESSDRGRMAVV
ncbi:hypothetical protein EX30DRAFT_313048 [Ascodesmis nigricans]|uniref:High-temperature-induced dauer-formation protein n=1 Tax=Ascodesmis nigricans TaxID=341454 RepID=A0A4S2N5A5_9PEZI|nr:hypothetical protein EX30DRAFT_313048 [Ascodesmis nigricans]